MESKGTLLAHCECEHVAHDSSPALPSSAGPTHPWATLERNVKPVKTLHGTYNLCFACRRVGHMTDID